MKYTVQLRCWVPALATVEVEANSEKAAHELVVYDIDWNAFESEYFTQVEYKPDWTKAEELEVI